MTALPQPPDAYWASIPWWAYLVFLLLSLVIIIIIGPWMIQRARNRPSAMLSREHALQSDQRGFETARMQHMADLKESERQARADLAKERTEQGAARRALIDDFQRAVDRGQSMESRARWYRHELVSAIQSFNTLLVHTRITVDGIKSAMLLPQSEKRAQIIRSVADRAGMVVENTKPMIEPPRVPSLNDMQQAPPS